MKILILGGTGAMGVPLVNILSEANEVWVSSRSARSSSGNVKYVQGNAKERSFLEPLLLQEDWDAVVDFMVRSRENLRGILPIVLENTRQYVFISSARVYAQSEGAITEETPRLLDCSTDEEFLKTEEYSLAKAREENLLLESEKKNWTIIRPSITYNDYRLQLGAFEKEGWLYRALHGRSIVFSEDLADKITTMTSGNDVAKGIAAIIGNPETLGEIYHITSPQALPWRNVLLAYKEALEDHLKRPVKVVMTEKTSYWEFKEQKYRLKYCRLYNRRFDNGKIGEYVDVSTFISPEDGLKDCLKAFLLNPRFQWIDWRLEGIHDRVSGERTPLSEIPTFPEKINYISYRYNCRFFLLLMKFIVKLKNTFRTI